MGLVGFKNIYLIGTSHISPESSRDVGKFISELRPEVVALELDPGRLRALFEVKQAKFGFKDIKSVGFKGFIFSLLGAWAERKLGEKVGTVPGVEMKRAIKSAKLVDAKLALIDQDIRLTLRKLSKNISWRDKFNFLREILKSVVWRKSSISFDLSSVPSDEVISVLVEEVKKTYPGIYKVLIAERNIIMAKRLIKLAHENKSVVAVVGAGHIDGMRNFIEKHYD